MSRTDRIAIAAGGGALLLAIAAAWILLAPVEGDSAEGLGDGASLSLATAGSPSPERPGAEHDVARRVDDDARPNCGMKLTGPRVARTRQLILDALDASR